MTYVVLLCGFEGQIKALLKKRAWNIKRELCISILKQKIVLYVEQYSKVIKFQKIVLTERWGSILPEVYWFDWCQLKQWPFDWRTGDTGQNHPWIFLSTTLKLFETPLKLLERKQNKKHTQWVTMSLLELLIATKNVLFKKLFFRKWWATEPLQKHCGGDTTTSHLGPGLVR